jgi:pyruvate,orthophosphate dikinase
MIAARAVVTEQGGSTSHAAVVGRALGLPCVVGCGAGTLTVLEHQIVTVDGQAGRIYRGALDTMQPDEHADERLVTLVAWARARAPLQVFAPTEVPDGEIVDLSRIAIAADPVRIGEVLASSRGGAKGARGGAIATPEGVRAAIAAGLKFIVAAPVLPPLLAAVQAGDRRATPEEESE